MISRIAVIVMSVLVLWGCKKQSPEQVAAGKIVEHFKSNPLQLAPEETPVDGVRRWVSSNSIHKIDEVYYSYGGDIALVLNKLLARATDKGEMPHLACNASANALMEILQAQGYETRRTFLFYDGEPSLKSHTFLEVRNPEKDRWEIQDPDYDIYYVERSSGDRVGTAQLLNEPLENFTPCKAPGDCGWHHAERLKLYFGAVGYKQKRTNPWVVVNAKRFDIEKSYKGGETFRNFINVSWGKGAAEIKVQP